MLEDKYLCETSFNLRDNIDNVYLENMLFEPFTMSYKGLKIEAVLSLVLVFLPRNLEISHMTLNRDLIDENF